MRLRSYGSGVLLFLIKDRFKSGYNKTAENAHKKTISFQKFGARLPLLGFDKDVLVDAMTDCFLVGSDKQFHAFTHDPEELAFDHLNKQAVIV